MNLLKLLSLFPEEKKDLMMLACLNNISINSRARPSLCYVIQIKHIRRESLYDFYYMDI